MDVDSFDLDRCDECPFPDNGNHTQGEWECQHPDAPDSSRIVDFPHDFPEMPPDWCPLRRRPLVVRLNSYWRSSDEMKDFRDKRTLHALRRTIEAAEITIERIEEGLPIDDAAGALGTNAVTALFELGSYAARDHARNAGSKSGLQVCPGCGEVCMRCASTGESIS